MSRFVLLMVVALGLTLSSLSSCTYKHSITECSAKDGEYLVRVRPMPRATLSTDQFYQPNEFILIDRLDRRPEFILYVQPDYPRSVKEAGIEGCVQIEALINEYGNVALPSVYRSSGNVRLDLAALNVSDQNIFRPAEFDGRRVACWVIYEVSFSLDDLPNEEDD